MTFIQIDDKQIWALSDEDAQKTVSRSIERSGAGSALGDHLKELCEGLDTKALKILVCGPTTTIPSTTSVQHDDAIFSSCFSLKDSESRVVRSDEIEPLKMRLIYGVKTDLIDILDKNFCDSKFQIKSALTPLLKKFAEQIDEHRRQRIYINCRHRFIDVMAYDGPKLMVLNTFPVNSVTDAVFYLMSINKTLGWSNVQTAFFVMGDTLMLNSVIEQMRRFVKVINPLTVLNEYGIASVSGSRDIPFALATEYCNQNNKR